MEHDYYDDDGDYDDDDYDSEEYSEDDDNVIDSLEESVRSSVEAAGEKITDKDQGAVHLAIKYAKYIDEGLASGDPERMNKAVYVGPQLLKALSELQLTPGSRVEAVGKDPKAYKESASVRARERQQAREKARKALETQGSK